MNEGDKVLVEGEITAVNPEWVMVKVAGLQGVEYVRARKALVHVPEAAKAPRKTKGAE